MEKKRKKYEIVCRIESNDDLGTIKTFRQLKEVIMREKEKHELDVQELMLYVNRKERK